MTPDRSGEIYALPVIPYLRLRFTLCALAAAHLPPYQGSMLRGAFGHALRRAVCAMGPQQPCESCRLRRACVYTRIFETFIEDQPPPLLRGLPTSPRPYVFEPRTDTRDFAPGDPLEFDLLLVGQAVELQAYVLLAVERLAAAGLGSGRVAFALSAASAQAPDGSWLPLFANGRAEGPTGVPPSRPAAAVPLGPRATVHLLTPLRIKTRAQLAEILDFRSLVFAMLRRTLELAHFHVPGADIEWSFRPLLDRAAAVRFDASDLTWHDWERYSNRQQTKMTFGGLTGTCHLEGDLAPFTSLLRTAEILHVGKGATFGLGKIAIP